MFEPKPEDIPRLDALAASFTPVYASGRCMTDLVENKDGSRRKPIVVWVDGCFDMMHYGHANALRQARAMGDFLVAGVHSDEEIRRNKGPPVMSESERYAAVAACKWVDVVVPRAPYSIVVPILDAFRCDFCVHGDDFSSTADGTDCYLEVKLANRYRECRRTRGISTTELVGRMLLMTRDHLPPSSSSSSNNTKIEQYNNDNSCDSLNNKVEMDTNETIVLNKESSSIIKTASTLKLESGGLVSKEEDLNFESNISPITPLSLNINNNYTAALHSLTTSSRIVQFSEGREPREGDKVVYYSGDFDLFHIGHIEALKSAKACGDFLLVGVYDDHTVNQLHGSNFPLMNLHERVLSVLSCRYVDEVVIGAPLIASKELLIGSSTAVGKISKVITFKNVPGENVENYQENALIYAREMGIVVELDWPQNDLASFTGCDILRRIIDHRKMYEERNRKKTKMF